ncbi:hypothetical protein PVK06_026447 [Gossypium arboreum]|uniref:Uncharacterized protein n=1 Tax=Gossypium arboreum TaxID=29729 RepID=A0ABR0NXP6_GOSAR|nr:hypothetical protein PVK06_026447 [Gossypium arboreum]
MVVHQSSLIVDQWVVGNGIEGESDVFHTEEGLYLVERVNKYGDECFIVGSSVCNYHVKPSHGSDGRSNVHKRNWTSIWYE